MVEKTPRTTTTTRTRAKSTVEDVPKVPKPRAPRAPRKTVSRTKVATPTEREEEKIVTRKAPTEIQFTNNHRRPAPIQLYVSLALFLVVFGFSAYIGISDRGQIDVSATIVAQVAKMQPNPDGTPVVVPAPPSPLSLGIGLVPSDPENQVPNVPGESVSVLAPTDSTTGSSTASTTDPTQGGTESETASSTEEVTDSATSESDVTEVEEVESVTTEATEPVPGV